METHAYSSDVAFSPSIKAVQARKGSRQAYGRMEERGSWPTRITPDLAAFIEAQTSVFLATASAEGQPYIQHRGGPAGFLRALDARTIGFVDFSGNRQFITQGNLAENPKAHLFLMDYAQRRRIKLWGEARVVEGDTEQTARSTFRNVSRCPMWPPRWRIATRASRRWKRRSNVCARRQVRLRLFPRGPV